MSKATFVSEIPDKIEGNEVPTLNLVKSMLTSENISDRIPEFNLRDVSGTEKYTVNGKDVSELSDVCYVGRGGPYMNANQSVLFKESVYTNHTVKLEYGGEVVSINSSNYESYTRGASVGNFQVAESKGEFVIGVDSNNNPTGIYKISVSFENGQKYEIEATVSGYKNKTTMNEDQVMSANAVRGYVEESVLLNLTTDNVHDRISTFTEGTYGYIVESPFVLVDNPGTSFLVDSDKVVGIDSSCFSGDVELKIEGFEYGGAVSKNPVKFECIIKGTSYSTNSSVLVGIENDPLPLLGLAKATKKVVGRIVAQKGNTSDFISRKFVIEKGPTDLNSDQLMTANAVRGYVDENTIKVRDFGEFTLTTEKNHIGFPILKYIWGDPYPYNEFILTFWTNKDEFYKCWGVNVSNSINSKIAVQKLGSDLGENELRIHVMPTGQYEINSGKYYASVGIQNKHLAENGITTLSHVRLMSKELDLPDEIDFDMYSISPAGLDTGSTIPKDIAS